MREIVLCVPKLEPKVWDWIRPCVPYSSYQEESLKVDTNVEQTTFLSQLSRPPADTDTASILPFSRLSRANKRNAAMRGPFPTLSLADLARLGHFC